MKYLVLGSSGQIGSALCSYLDQKGHEVIPYDITLGASYDLRSSFYKPKLMSYVQQSDFVFFLAFDVGGSRYLKKYQDTYEFIDNNVLIMNNVFHSLQYYNKPFIFASSQMSNMVDSPYGVLKRIGEQYTKSIKGISVKFWNVYGIEHDPEKTHVITDLILKAFKGRIDVQSSGKEQRQFLHSRDCSEVLCGLSQHYKELVGHEPFNITSHKWVTIANVAEIISNEFGGIPISFGKQEDLQTIKNEAEFNTPNWWYPKIPLDTGIREIIKYYELHNGKDS